MPIFPYLRMPKITNGYDFNYFTRVTVSAAAFGDNADITIPFRGNPSFSLTNEGTGIIEYSFNGNTLHGDILASSTLISNHRGVSQIWLRLKSGSASSLKIEASAEAVFSGGYGGNGVSSTVTANIGSSGALALDATVTALSAKVPAVLGPTTPANSLSVVGYNSTSLGIDNNYAVLNTAAAIGGVTTYKGGVWIQCLSTSSASAFIGGSASLTTTKGIELAPGDKIFLNVASLANIFAIAAASSTATLTILGIS